MLSKVQKRELAWYKVALAAFESGEYRYHGVCEVLKVRDDVFYKMYVVDNMRSEDLLPCLRKRRTKYRESAYWFYDREQRIEALKKTIETLEKEDTLKEYNKTVVVATIIAAVVALFYIVKLSLSNA